MEEDVLEIWEFTDHHPSGKLFRYQLESRSGELSIHSDDPAFADRRAKLGDRVLVFLKYLIGRSGERCFKTAIESQLWKGAKDPGIVDAYIKLLRKLLNDDARSNRLGDVLGGRIVQSLKGEAVRFAPEVKHTPGAHIQKITRIGPFSSVPPLVHFIERPEISEPLANRLCEGSGPVGLTAIEGMGGVGKTMLAIKLCHDEKVRQAFPDGIIWLGIGKESAEKFDDRVKMISQAMNQEFRVYSQESYRSLFKDRSVLVVLDDVWTVKDVEPFLLPYGRSRLLYTSRDKSLAGSLHAESQEVGKLDHAQALHFLESWSRREGTLPEYASDILSQCDGLALAVSMVGAALNGKRDEDWADMLTDLRKAKLKKIRNRPAGYKYDTIHAAIAVSVATLEPIIKERYLRLAVLLEGLPAATPILQALWAVVDEQEVRDTARLLAERSLARRASEGLQLHDLQLDYIRGEHSDPEALALENSALRRSYHVIKYRPGQFFSQMTGRLLAHANQPGVATFLSQLRDNSPRPRLRPCRAALDPAGGPIVRVLDADSWSASSVAVTEDGSRAATGGGTLTIWDLTGNQPPRILQNPRKKINAVALALDGKRAVSGHEDGGIIIWDLEDHAPPHVLEGHKYGVNAVALSSDETRVISASVDGVIRVWDLHGHQPPRILKGHEVVAVALTREGRTAIAVSHGDRLTVWDLDNHKPRKISMGHRKFVGVAALTPDGNRVVSGSNDGVLVVWDLDGKEAPRVLEGPKQPVTAVALTSDARRVISGFADGTLLVWDLVGYHPPQFLEGHMDRVNAVAVTADGSRALSASEDGMLIEWALDGYRPPDTLKDHIGPVYVVGLTNHGKRAVFGSDNETLTVWDLDGLQEPRILKGHNQRVTAVALTPDYKRAISGSQDGMLLLWDLEGRDPPRVLDCHMHPITAVAITPDGKRVVSTSHSARGTTSHLEFCDAAECLEPHRHIGKFGKRMIRQVVDHIASVRLIVQDLDDARPPCVLDIDEDSGRAVAVASDGKRVIGSAWSGLIVWDLEKDQPARVLEGEDMVDAVAVTDAGDCAVSGSSEGAVYVWDLEGRRPPQILRSHTERIVALALSRDGRRAVSASGDKTLIVWDLESEKPLAAFTCDFPVQVCAYFQRYIAAGDSRGNVHLLALEE